MTATAVATETNRYAVLNQRLEEGPLPLAEALRYSTMLAEALRQVHDSGRTFGGLQPSSVVLAGAGVELIPALEPGAITPYTAPEILQGRPADSRSDIFAFGAIIYEMITGRRAFGGDNADALAVSLTISAPPPSGVPAIDHLVANCLAKDPSVRCSRMQKVILELKLIGFAATGPEGPGRQQVATAALRAETQQLGGFVNALLESHEEAINQIQQATRNAMGELREQVSALRSELAAAHERSARLEQEHGDQVSALKSELAAAQERSLRAEEDHHGQYQRIMACVDQAAGNIQALDGRLAAGESKVEFLSQGVTMLQEYGAARMQEFEQTLRSQSAEIALVSASQVQTDDLVEHVVTAMEVLKTNVFEYAEE